jgi:hypothetical protein
MSLSYYKKSETIIVIEDGKEYEVYTYFSDVHRCHQWKLKCHQWELNTNGKLYRGREFHREKGPAIFGNSIKYAWYHNGFCHRLDGPAEIWRNGTNIWSIYNKEIKEQAHAKVRTMLSLGLDKI